MHWMLLLEWNQFLWSLLPFGSWQVWERALCAWGHVAALLLLSLPAGRAGTVLDALVPFKPCLDSCMLSLRAGDGMQPAGITLGVTSLQNSAHRVSGVGVRVYSALAWAGGLCHRWSHAWVPLGAIMFGGTSGCYGDAESPACAPAYLAPGREPRFSRALVGSYFL